MDVTGFLLTRSWHDDGDGLRFTLWAATDAGPVRVDLRGQEAVFFVERHVETQGGDRKPVELRSLLDRPVDAVYFGRQRELVDEQQRLRSTLSTTLEADVRPVERFLMERFITAGLRIRGEPVRKGDHLVFTDPQIAAVEHEPNLSVCSFDIETDGVEGPLLSIAVVTARVESPREAVFMRGEGVDTDIVRYLPDERAVLDAFIDFVGETDPDLLVGWNVIEFDLAYLQRKAEELGVRLSLGRGRGRAVAIGPRNPSQPWVARVPGRVVLDGIATMRTATWSFESFSLENVSRQLLGRGKKITRVDDRLDEIRRMYREDKASLAAYNLEDCRLVVDVFDTAHLIEFAVQRQRLTGLPMDRQGGSVAAFDYLYLPRLHRAGYVASDVGSPAAGIASPGGIVLESAPGLYDNVIVLDFKSLYPSIIRTFRIDPLGMAIPGEDPIPGFEGATFARERHILPELIESLWKERDAAKRRGDEPLSRAIKILMNSFYGVLGTPGCRFFSPALASSITRRGHEIITGSRDFLQGRRLSVIYGDTDSLFVHLGSGKSDAECRKEGASLAGALNAYWRDRVQTDYRVDSQLEVEFETNYERFFMPTLRGSERGSKKRYAGVVRRRDGAREIVFKGLEAVRTDWSPLARRFQRELFRRVFAGEEWEEWMKKLAADLEAGLLDDELVYRKRLRRQLDEYERNLPPHVQAARMLDRPPRTIEYVITLDGPVPIQLVGSRRIDYAHYLDKQLAPAADGLLAALGTSFARIAGKQLTLF